jgi:hypothetical protein
VSNSIISISWCPVNSSFYVEHLSIYTRCSWPSRSYRSCRTTSCRRLEQRRMRPFSVFQRPRKLAKAKATVHACIRAWQVGPVNMPAYVHACQGHRACPPGTPLYIQALLIIYLVCSIYYYLL